jgi:hypothetical protein
VFIMAGIGVHDDPDSVFSIGRIAERFSAGGAASGWWTWRGIVRSPGRWSKNGLD